MWYDKIEIFDALKIFVLLLGLMLKWLDLKPKHWMRNVSFTEIDNIVFWYFKDSFCSFIICYICNKAIIINK